MLVRRQHQPGSWPATSNVFKSCRLESRTPLVACTKTLVNMRRVNQFKAAGNVSPSAYPACLRLEVHPKVLRYTIAGRVEMARRLQRAIICCFADF